MKRPYLESLTTAPPKGGASSSPYDDKGLFIDAPHMMHTFSGRRVDPLNLRAEDVDIKDIAHALARQCRFNGHCAGYLSVAAHSVRVHDLLAGTPHQLWGLLHDAAETYLGDMIRPMKHSGDFDEYYRAEAVAERAIADRFGLTLPIPPEVHAADSIDVLDELNRLWCKVGWPDRDELEFLERFARYEGDRNAR